MAKSNAVTIAEIQITLKQIEKEIIEIKEGLKNIPTKEAFNNLELRVKKGEDNESKLVWLVAAAIIAEILKSIFMK